MKLNTIFKNTFWETRRLTACPSKVHAMRTGRGECTGQKPADHPGEYPEGHIQLSSDPGAQQLIGGKE
jgi:hypothetical protein